MALSLPDKFKFIIIIIVIIIITIIYKIFSLEGSPLVRKTEQLLDLEVADLTEKVNLRERNTNHI